MNHFLHDGTLHAMPIHPADFGIYQETRGVVTSGDSPTAKETATATTNTDPLLAVGSAFIDFVIDHPHRFQLLFRQPMARANNPLQKSPAPNTSFGDMVELENQ